jgi:hypothetical protein
MKNITIIPENVIMILGNATRLTTLNMTLNHSIHQNLRELRHRRRRISLQHYCTTISGRTVNKIAITYEGGPKNNRNRPIAHACFLVTSCAAR